MAASWSMPFYNSKDWKELRMMLIIQRGATCERCHKDFLFDTSRLIGHHKKELTPDTICDPTIALNPDNIEIIYVETARPDGPFGASGVGEMPLTSPHAAVINGIYNACGARIRKLPALPEKVLAAMPK